MGKEEYVSPKIEVVQLTEDEVIYASYCSSDYTCSYCFDRPSGGCWPYTCPYSY